MKVGADVASINQTGDLVSIERVLKGQAIEPVRLLADQNRRSVGSGDLMQGLEEAGILVNASQPRASTCQSKTIERLKFCRLANQWRDRRSGRMLAPPKNLRE